MTRRDISKTEMSTHGGRWIDVLAPDPTLINIDDVAHGLSHLCRYTGHVKRFYSVAEHCVLMTRYLREQGHGPDVQMEALLHDASEAYLGDVSRPLKSVLPEYVTIEDRFHRAVGVAFGVTWRHHDLIKQTDTAILLDEKAQAIDECVDWGPLWGGRLDALGVRLEFWAPVRARYAFLCEYEALRALMKEAA